MANINWIEHTEKVVGQGHATLTDVVNRPLRELLTALGVDPDSDITSLPVGPVDWSVITSKPTTIAGYGITDAYTDAEVDAILADYYTETEADVLLAGKANVSHTHAWADITSGKPTTLAGYGITDAFSPAREVDQIVTASLADLASENGTVTLGKKGSILQVESDVAAWVRLYATAADRTADSGRLISEDPADGVFVLADLIFSVSLLTIGTAPVIGYYNNDGPVGTDIYYRIQNLSGGATAVTVDITHIVEEVA